MLQKVGPLSLSVALTAIDWYKLQKDWVMNNMLKYILLQLKHLHDIAIINSITCIKKIVTAKQIS